MSMNASIHRRLGTHVAQNVLGLVNAALISLPAFLPAPILESIPGTLASAVGHYRLAFATGN
jgi:hypothetical protein